MNIYRVHLVVRNNFLLTIVDRSLLTNLMFFPEMQTTGFPLWKLNVAAYVTLENVRVIRHVQMANRMLLHFCVCREFMKTSSIGASAKTNIVEVLDK